MNKAFVLGYLGRDAETRFTAGGTPVATFSMATTEKFTDKEGQKRENTQWHRIVLWGKQAETLQEFLKKGKQVLVEGSLETREWTNKEGQKVKTTEIKAQRVTLLGSGGDKSATTVAKPDAKPDMPDTSAERDTQYDDDIPF